MAKVRVVQSSAIDAYRIASNNRYPAPSKLGEVARLYNWVSAHRRKQFLQWSRPYANFLPFADVQAGGTSGTPKDIFVGTFHTSPSDCKRILTIVTVPHLQNDNDSPEWKINLKQDGGGFVTKSLYGEDKIEDTGFTRAVPADQFLVRQELHDNFTTKAGLTKDTTYHIKIQSINDALINGISIYEVPNDFLDTTDSDHNVIDPKQFAPGQIIILDHATSLFTGQNTLWQNQAAPIFNQNIDSGQTSVGTAAWVEFDDYYSYSPTSHNAIESNNIPVVFWFWGFVDAGTGQARLLYQPDSGGSNTIATISTVTATSLTEYTATGNVDASWGDGRFTIEVQATSSDTLTIHGYGVYEHE